MRAPKKLSSILQIIVASAMLVASTGNASADPVEDFYRGKRINLVIGYGTGGGYDTYAKLLARFIGDHIPGKPTIITQNMPGAGSRVAANWLFNVAPQDGTTIATVGQTTPTDQALGAGDIKFDVRKFHWIGNMVQVNNVLFVRAASSIHTIDDVKKTEVPLGASGASSPSVLYPLTSNKLLGTRFKIVSGYQGSGDVSIAIERGEVEGRGSDSWASIKANHPHWIKDNYINVLFQVGLKKEPDLDAPLWLELAHNDEQRQVLEVLSGDVAVGKPFLAGPGVPADRVQALRRAFDATMKDPKFLEAAEKMEMYLNPVSGTELQDIVSRIVDRSPEVLAKVKAAVEIDAK
jgi:tripartite-type tricarboxylate transporter receptor subunit TctC